MAFHDLNVTYFENDSELANTLAFLVELGYDTVALSTSILSKVPSQLPRIPLDRIQIPTALKVLTRLNLTISDTSQNHRITQLNTTYDLLALRPTTDKSFQLCCASLDCDIISLDFTSRLPYPIKFKTVASALQRGIRFEICYSPGIVGSSDARRNLISGAAGLIRATRSRGIILSSEAKNALGLRGPYDVINLATVWGLTGERAREAVCEEAGRVVRLAGVKRSSFRGVVDLIEDGSHETVVELGTGGDETCTFPPTAVTDGQDVKDRQAQPLPPLKQVTVIPEKVEKAKRKASQISLNEQNPAKVPDTHLQLSKREAKRQAKKARLDRAAGKSKEPEQQKSNGKVKGKFDVFAIQHEALAMKTSS